MTEVWTRPNYGQMQLDVMRGKDPGGVMWQPRLEYWYFVNKTRGTLPAHLRQASLLDVYDYVYGSCRYFLWDHSWLTLRYHKTTITTQWEDTHRLRQTWHTPLGNLSQVLHYDEWKISMHIVEHRIKSPDDLVILSALYEDERWDWNQTAYDRDLAEFGAYGAPQFYFRRSPLQRLILDEMGFEQAMFFMIDHPQKLAEYMAFATAADDPMYEIICNSPAQILNFGENIDGTLNPPPVWTAHLAPYYTARLNQLHQADKLVYIHMDGTLKPLLPHIHDCPWDAIEAATPVPQGDVTLEQIKTAFGDTPLLDGIPALYFLPDLYPVECLTDSVHQVVDLFYPRLVLGVSDEVPPDSDIERVRMVGQIVNALNKQALLARESVN